ncbi:MAG: hypothetical protein ACLR70_06635 [Streptococcus thermophilus]
MGSAWPRPATALISSKSGSADVLEALGINVVGVARDPL